MAKVFVSKSEASIGRGDGRLGRRRPRRNWARRVGDNTRPRASVVPHAAPFQPSPPPCPASTPRHGLALVMTMASRQAWEGWGGVGRGGGGGAISPAAPPPAKSAASSWPRTPSTTLARPPARGGRGGGPPPPSTRAGWRACCPPHSQTHRQQALARGGDLLGLFLRVFLCFFFGEGRRAGPVRGESDVPRACVLVPSSPLRATRPPAAPAPRPPGTG